MTVEITLRSDMGVRYIAHMGDDLFIARAAWEDWDREPKSEEHLSGMVGGMVREMHGSPTEFGALVVHIEVPLFTVEQIKRHRIGVSPAERSLRYKKAKPVFYSPAQHRPLINLGTKMRPELHFLNKEDDLELHNRSAFRDKYLCSRAWETYQEALADGEAEEIARRHLPVQTYTGYSMQFNPRSLMKFLQLRVDDPENRYPTHPQYEIQEVARKIEDLFAQYWPLTHRHFHENGRVAP